MTLVYLWIAALFLCLIALITITYYESLSLAPDALRDFLQSLKGSLTKGKDMKQDLSSAIFFRTQTQPSNIVKPAVNTT